MRSIFLIFSLAIFTLASCNYKLFVNKRHVVQEDHGYLIFKDDFGVYFFPTKDTIDTKFLSDKRRLQGRISN